MTVSVRQSKILKLVRQQGSCTVVELSERLEVSDETIRRNVKPLVSEGLVIKVHGGIILPHRFEESPIQRRMLDNREAKERIAALVAQQVQDGDSLVLDTGSTTIYVARALSGHSNLVVVTNSTRIARYPWRRAPAIACSWPAASCAPTTPLRSVPRPSNSSAGSRYATPSSPWARCTLRKVAWTITYAKRSSRAPP